MKLFFLVAVTKIIKCANCGFSNIDCNESNNNFDEILDIFLQSDSGADLPYYDVNDKFNDINTDDILNHDQDCLQFDDLSEGNGENMQYSTMNKKLNSESNLKNGNDQANLCKGSIMASSNKFFLQNRALLVTQNHIDFMKNILKDLSVELNRPEIDDSCRNFLTKSFLWCAKLLEDFENFRIKNYTTFYAFLCQYRIETTKLFVINLNLQKETKSFLIYEFLKNNISVSKDEYYRSLISHINEQLGEKSINSFSYYQAEGFSFEENESLLKRKRKSSNMETNEEDNDSNKMIKSQRIYNIVLKNISFSKNHFYVLYNDPQTSSTVLLKYNYKSNNSSHIFSVDNLDLNAKEIMFFGKYLKNIFLDSDGTFYFLLQQSTAHRKCSYVKKIKEEQISEQNTKINEKEDLLLEGIFIDSLYFHLGRLYLLDTTSKKMLIFSKDFRKINEIKFDYNGRICKQSSKILFAIKDHIVVIINATVFIWRIDSKNLNFTTVVDDKKIYRFFNYALFYENHKFICKCFVSNMFYVYEIKDIEGFARLDCHSVSKFPKNVKQKNCKIFKFPDQNDIYCAYFENKTDLKVQRIGNIENI